MESSTPEFSSARDDPLVYDHEEWHGLVHKVVKGLKFELNPATGKYESVLAVYTIVKAAVSKDTIVLHLRRWFPSTVARSQEFSVGGSRDLGYGPALRPDGGFQVVGEKYIPLNDRNVNSLAAAFTASEFRELQVFLKEAE